MDLKQFNIFQEAIQWVVDEQRRRRADKDIYEMTGRLRHFQQEWGMGRVVAERLAAHPSYQMVCPTACCVAGNIVLINGDRFVVDSVLPEDSLVAVQSCVTDKGEIVDIDDRAIEVVGLDAVEAMNLFSGGNSWRDIVHCATKIAKAHGHTLEVI
jgi:hypothetical protein